MLFPTTENTVDMAGHLFQNRYKSILCQEDAYLKELVRYIHLNPLRAQIVADIQKLDKYPYAGHSAILGKVTNTWQDVDGVLGLFDDKVSLARRSYRSLAREEVNQKRQDLTGGGLIRSLRRWTNVIAMRKANLFQKSDERILGDGNFVEKVLSESQEQMEKKYQLSSQGVTIDTVLKISANLMNIEPELVFFPGKERSRVKARSLFTY